MQGGQYKLSNQLVVHNTYLVLDNKGQPNAEQIVRPVAAVQPAIADPTLNANMLPIEHYLPSKLKCL